MEQAQSMLELVPTLAAFEACTTALSKDTARLEHPAAPPIDVRRDRNKPVLKLCRSIGHSSFLFSLPPGDICYTNSLAQLVHTKRLMIYALTRQPSP
jgi:hypothetical protein